jgi:hypothetical protein
MSWRICAPYEACRGRELYDGIRAWNQARDAGMPAPTSAGTPEEVAKLMEYRSFGPGKLKGFNFATYYRHDGDIQITVRFKNDTVVSATIVFAGNDDRKGSSETRDGFKGLFEFAQAYGD